jgi:disulfide bond formation protein DsbB
MPTLPRSLQTLTPLQAALGVFILAFATIAGAWIFEWAGYLPCELCLMQRWAYYGGVPLAALTALVAAYGPRRLAGAGLALLGLVFVGSMVFGVYHAGVEWGFWAGPSGCTGALTRADSMQDFMKQLETAKVVRCDAVAIRILGLSLAGWNAMISATMATLALFGARKALA